MLKLGRTKGAINFKGCNEDCFNCPYPDCYKPVNKIKHNDTFFVSKAKGESQSKMYTLALGGYGGARPNISKKFYF